MMEPGQRAYEDWVARMLWENRGRGSWQAWRDLEPEGKAAWAKVEAQMGDGS